MFKGTITLPFEQNQYAYLSTEGEVFFNKRAGFEVTKNETEIIISFFAQDPSALKSVTSSITRLLSIFEKMKSVGKQT